MKQYLTFLSLLALVCCIAPSCTSYYYIVRHAEKDTAPMDNPGLTDAGNARARILRDTLRHKNITRVFVSNTTRSLKTAEPTIGLGNITVSEYNAREPVQNLVGKIRALDRDPNVLIVGHTNTIPDLIFLLTGTTVAPIPETVYDRFFVVKRKGDWRGGRFSLLRQGTYGPASH